MFQICFALFVLQLVFFQAFGIATIPCDQNETSVSFLEVAQDMINKAKLYFPVCPTTPQNSIYRPMDCEEVLRSGRNKSGVYTIWPRGRIMADRPLDVFCDMDTDDGGWTVIQRRGNFRRPADYFFKDWSSYKAGFGDIQKDFWIGNDNIFVLTNQRPYSIRFNLKAVDREKRYALYDEFWLEDESNKYRLHIKDYSGDAGDSMIEAHNNHKFTTKDQDNDNSRDNCAVKCKGAWWYSDCHHSNLNGMYYRGPHKSLADGVNWHAFKGHSEALETTVMMIRPKNFEKKLGWMDTPL